MDKLKIGDICRAKCTAPARYIGNGRCLYVSATTNDIGEDNAQPATGGENNLPLVSDKEIEAWNTR